MINIGNELDFVLKSHQSSPKRQLNNVLPPDHLSSEINISIQDSPFTKEEIRGFLDSYLKYSVNTQHPYYMNQLWSQTEDSSLMGEILSALTNTSMYTYEVAPVATLLELKMSHFLSKMIWGKPTEGIMTSGGTASNMQALLTARNTHFPESKNDGLNHLKEKPVILCAKNSHYSIKRAANIIGIGQSQLIEVEVNEQGSMSPQKLEQAIETVISEGMKPFCVVSTAGTTVTGSYDDFNGIGKICQNHNLWYHIDGAYGGSSFFSKSHSHLLAGAQCADSFSWDFHKILGVHLPCAFLFTREKGLLRKSISSGNDAYLFHDDDSIDLGQSSLQCGRRNDILKLWMTFMYNGVSGISKRVDTLFDIAHKLSDRIKNDSDFELIMPPQSINVCFRYKNSQLTSKIREELNQTGKLMINYSTDNKGDFFRFASTNPYLSDADLYEVLHLIKTTGNKLNQEQ